MKQKLEAAARENILFNHRTVDRTLSGKYLAQFGEMNFIQGAEWHAKQSPWISIEEQPVNIYDDFLVTDGKKVYKAYTNGNNKWYIADRLDKYRLEGIIAYMPIPSFDEILETNRDVLERIKEKGD